MNGLCLHLFASTSGSSPIVLFFMTALTLLIVLILTNFGLWFLHKLLLYFSSKLYFKLHQRTEFEKGYYSLSQYQFSRPLQPIH